MTIISGPVKSVAYHPDVSEATAAYSASVIDVFEARHRLLSESVGTAKEAKKEQGNRRAVYWLISLAALVCLLVGLSAWRSLLRHEGPVPINFGLLLEVNRVKPKLHWVKPSRRSVFDISRFAGIRKSDFTIIFN